MDDEQKSDQINNEDAFAQIEEQNTQTISDDISSASPKKSNKKKLIFFVFLLVVLILGTYFLFFNDKDSDKQPITVAPEEQSVEPKQSKWLIYLNKSVVGENDTTVTEMVYEVSYDGQSARQLDETKGDVIYDSVSPSSKYFVNSDKTSITIFSKDDTEGKKIVIGESDEDIRYEWYPDETKLIASTLVTKNKPSNSDSFYVPDNHQEFFTVDVATGDKKLLFEHDEIYGGAYIRKIDSENNVFYWLTTGEGGIRDPLNVSDLTTGKLISKYDNSSAKLNGAVGLNSVSELHIQDQIAYAIDRGETSSLISYDTETKEIKSIADYKFLTEETVSETCSAGELIHDLIIDESEKRLIFSVLNNKTNTTKFMAYDIANMSKDELFTLDGIFGDSLELVDGDNLISSSSFGGLCSASDKPGQSSSNTEFKLYMNNLASGERKEIILPGTEGQSIDLLSYSKGFLIVE